MTEVTFHYQIPVRTITFNIMAYVVEGILAGFSLAILLGPIFIVLVQTAIEKGARAGISVGLVFGQVMYL